MASRISADWGYRGMRALVLENALVRAVVLPDLGIKIHEFSYKPADRDFLYHHPRVEPRSPTYGVNVDNWWSGGLDEAIPTGHPSTVDGEDYPFLGEVWSLPWDYQIEARGPDVASVHLWRETVIAPLRVERWLTVHDGEPVLRMRHRVTNVGTQPFSFLWGLHPGFAVSEGYRIDVPAGSGVIEESLPEDRLGLSGTKYDWPWANGPGGATQDMRIVPSAAVGTMDFHYLTNLTAGWLAVTDPEAQIGCGLVFPRQIFDTVWVWLVNGGWRGVQCAAVEAWNGYPARLSQALEAGRGSTLAPGEQINCETSLVAFQGVRAVGDLTLAGEVEEPEAGLF